MSDLVDPAMIEKIVGVPRHPIEHIVRVVDEDRRVYILHSAECKESGRDLRDCPFSIALDEGVDIDKWTREPTRARIIDGELVPV